MNRIPLLSYLLLITLIALTASPKTRAADYFPPPDSAGGWRELKDAEQIRTLAGMDLQRLEQAAENCKRGTQHGGLLVVRHGYLVLEKYWGRAFRDANPDMASTGKAFTSIACGIMLHEKHEAIPDGLNTKVFIEKYLPEAFPLDDPRKADITLGQLLCMSAGYHGEGNSPGVVNGEVVPLTPVPGQDLKDLDKSSIRTVLWTKPGAGYSYSSPAPHIASIVLRHVTGMELKDYIDEKLAKPMGWGPWNYCLFRGPITLPHANGAGSTALHATDALRFGYMLLHKGKWNDKQLVPAEYVELCGKPSPHNPHAPYSLQFEVNADAHVELAPRDAYWKSGAGGFAIYVIPSLDMVIYKMGGTDGFYKQELTGIPQNFKYDGSRDNWKPYAGTPFVPGGGGGISRVLELVSGAVVK